MAASSRGCGPRLRPSGTRPQLEPGPRMATPSQPATRLLPPGVCCSGAVHPAEPASCRACQGGPTRVRVLGALEAARGGLLTRGHARLAAARRVPLLLAGVELQRPARARVRHLLAGGVRGVPPVVLGKPHLQPPRGHARRAPKAVAWAGEGGTWVRGSRFRGYNILHGPRSVCVPRAPSRRRALGWCSSRPMFRVFLQPSSQTKRPSNGGDPARTPFRP